MAEITIEKLQKSIKWYEERIAEGFDNDMNYWNLNTLKEELQKLLSKNNNE
jgi:hypothetical protein